MYCSRNINESKVFRTKTLTQEAAKKGIINLILSLLLGFGLMYPQIWKFLQANRLLISAKVA